MLAFVPHLAAALLSQISDAKYLHIGDANILEWTSSYIASYWIVDKPKRQQFHIHLALTDERALNANGMVVSFSTKDNKLPGHVQYMKESENVWTDVIAQECVSYTCGKYKSNAIYHAVISANALTPGERYKYRCGHAELGWTENMTFRMPEKIGSRTPMRLVIIGDLGQTKNSQDTMRYVWSEKDTITAILHVGDLSYADGYQVRWDTWETMVEPYASSIPWMVAAGNHEVEKVCLKDGDVFAAYQTRFRMPYTTEMPDRNLYYAFRLGMAYIIVLTPYLPTAATSPQYIWLEKELASVNRVETPWLVVLMHAPWYNSNEAHQDEKEPQFNMKLQMEDLLYRHQVNIVFAGHVHAYERSLPVYKNIVDQKGIVYVVVGDGGNREGLASSFLNPQPTWSVRRDALYGFVNLNIQDDLHASIEWIADGKAKDAYEIINFSKK